MTDIALLWSNDSFSGDIAIDDGRLATDDGLRTAILISLFTDARARADDVLPDAGGDPRGWWGNAFAAEADEGEAFQLGSRLWLLDREKLTAATVERARTYAAEAIAWLKDRGIVSYLGVDAARFGDQAVGLRVWFERPEGPARQFFDFTWEASLGV